MSDLIPKDFLVPGLLALSCLLFLLTIFLMRALILTRRNFARENKRRLEQSRAVLKGQAVEQLAPLLPGFPYSLKDARFMGQPVDYLIYSGLAETGQVRELVFCEIKTGQSRLTPVEVSIKEAVESGRIRFETWRLAANGQFYSE